MLWAPAGKPPSTVNSAAPAPAPGTPSSKRIGLSSRRDAAKPSVLRSKKAARISSGSMDGIKVCKQSFTPDATPREVAFGLRRRRNTRQQNKNSPAAQRSQNRRSLVFGENGCFTRR